MTNLFKKSLPIALVLLLAVAILSVCIFSGAASIAAEAQTYDGQLILDQVVVSTADEATDGVFRSIAQGDTFTVTYKLIKNDGMVDAFFTPAYDKDVFELTSFTVGSDWALFDNYGGSVFDEELQDYRPMNAAEYIADRNAKYAAEEIDDFLLTFEVHYGDVRDPAGVTSDSFITIVYTARVALEAPLTDSPDFSFGLDMSEDGFYTNAAKTGDDLLEMLIKTGMDGEEILTAPVSEEMYSFAVMAETAVSVAADQTISFAYDETLQAYVLDLDEIEWTLTVGDKDAYLEDGGSIAYTFYVKDGDEFVEITAGDGLPALPDLTDIYVSATIPGTDHYTGSATAEPVHIAIAPVYVNLPDLKLYDKGDHAETPATYDADYVITAEVTYGTKFTLKQLVDEEEVEFSFPESYAYTFERIVEEVPEEYATNPLTEDLLNVGTYQVIISTLNTDFIAFDNGSNDDLLTSVVIKVTVTKATVTLDALVGGESNLNLTYGDAAPAETAFTVTANGIFETGDDLTAVLEAIAATTSSEDAYDQFDGVGTYTYTASGTSTDNYDVVSGESATITVAPKALTLSVQYEGGVATFTMGGIVNEDAVTPTYYVGETTLAANTFTATAAGVGQTLTAKVLPDELATNYAVSETLTLAAVYEVSFAAGADFAAATGMPAAQYVFSGTHATEPDEPTFANHDFLYWTLNNTQFDFDTDTVTADTVLTAKWEKMIFAYKFRAIYSEAELLSNKFYALAWDSENNKFVINTALEDEKVVAAADAPSATFHKYTAIPTNVEIKAFYLVRWYKVIPQAEGDPIVTEVTVFEPDGSIENNEGAYYLAQMYMSIGRGDVDGDGFVTIEDLLSIRMFFTSGNCVVLQSEASVWQVALREESVKYFFKPMWDVNNDGYKDSRDIVALREALATGYGYEVVTDKTVIEGEDGVYCPGQQVVREEATLFDGKVTLISDGDDLDEALTAGLKVGLTADVDLGTVVREYDYEVCIDLGGHTIEADTLIISAEGAVFVKNGVLDVSTLNVTSNVGITFQDVVDGNGNPLEADGTVLDFSHVA